MTILSIKSSLKVTLVSGLILLCTACASSDGAEGDDVASERECRSFAQPGTKMRESVCRTREQWAMIDAGEAERDNRESLVDEFFRRQSELGAQGQGPAFDSAGDP